MNLEYIKDVLIPYRLKSLKAMHQATEFIVAWGKPVSIEISFDGKMLIEGLSTAYTNPVIEAGILHSRALLEFMGLCLDKNNKINNIKKRRDDDIGIENFSNTSGFLSLVSPERAIQTYCGSKSEAEQALASILRTTNKSLAHFTIDSEHTKADIKSLDIASRGIEVLMANNFYIPLGIDPPDFSIKSRPRVN